MPMPRVRPKNLMSGDRYFLCEEERKYRMNLKDQLKKVMDDQEKLERKKDKFLEEYDEKKKKILLKKKDLKQKIQKEKNEKILQAVQESFGEIDEKNMDAFLDILKKNGEEFSLEMEIASENLEESDRESEEHIPDFGTEQKEEDNPYPFGGNES